MWDIFCRVIDNFGDAGVCWRLSRRLSELGDHVRLWIDDASPLRFMAPQGHPGIEIRPWPTAPPLCRPGQVVVEAFGCDLPPAWVQAMAGMHPPPVWLNLEYFTAEGQAQRNHGLPSPQRNGLMKWFVYPGLHAQTGGLLREASLPLRQATFDRDLWLRSMGVDRRPHERVISLFCYDTVRLRTWWPWLSAQATHLLVTPGAATRQARDLPASPLVQVHELPWLSQEAFDELLWACDLNAVRGEDSLVRAVLAGRPLLWQIYPQDDEAHHAKLDAFLDWYVDAQAPHPLAHTLRTALRHWAGTTTQWPQLHGPALQAQWTALAQHAAQRACALPELAHSMRTLAFHHRGPV